MTFSIAARCGSRWKDWKTKPICLARTADLSRSEAWPRFIPSISSVPFVGRSSSPSRFSRVDLPEPDGPVIDTCSPGQTARSASRSAATGGGPG